MALSPKSPALVSDHHDHNHSEKPKFAGVPEGDDEPRRPRDAKLAARRPTAFEYSKEQIEEEDKDEENNTAEKNKDKKLTSIKNLVVPTLEAPKKASQISNKIASDDPAAAVVATPGKAQPQQQISKQLSSKKASQNEQKAQSARVDPQPAAPQSKRGDSAIVEAAAAEAQRSKKTTSLVGPAEIIQPEPINQKNVNEPPQPESTAVPKKSKTPTDIMQPAKPAPREYHESPIKYETYDPRKEADIERFVMVNRENDVVIDLDSYPECPCASDEESSSSCACGQDSQPFLRRRLPPRQPAYIVRYCCCQGQNPACSMIGRPIFPPVEAAPYNYGTSRAYGAPRMIPMQIRQEPYGTAAYYPPRQPRFRQRPPHMSNRPPFQGFPRRRALSQPEFSYRPNRSSYNRYQRMSPGVRQSLMPDSHDYCVCSGSPQQVVKYNNFDAYAALQQGDVSQPMEKTLYKSLATSHAAKKSIRGPIPILRKGSSKSLANVNTPILSAPQLLSSKIQYAPKSLIRDVRIYVIATAIVAMVTLFIYLMSDHSIRVNDKQDIFNDDD